MGLLRKRSSTSAESWQLKKTCQIFSYLIIIDFESTCWKDTKYRSQEIIEFPAVLLDTKSGEIESEFHYYIQPQENPVLSKFCTELTGIIQDQVEKGIPLSVCLRKFSHWLKKISDERKFVYNIAVDPAQKVCTFVTWSDWDLGVCLKYETQRKQLRTPVELSSWIDLRATYRKFYDRKPNGLNGALQDLGITFEGREHSGIVDSRNTAILAYRMMCDGCIMEITKTVSGAMPTTIIGHNYVQKKNADVGQIIGARNSHQQSNTAVSISIEQKNNQKGDSISKCTENIPSESKDVCNKENILDRDAAIVLYKLKDVPSDVLSDKSANIELSKRFMSSKESSNKSSCSLFKNLEDISDKSVPTYNQNILRESNCSSKLSLTSSNADQQIKAKNLCQIISVKMVPTSTDSSKKEVICDAEEFESRKSIPNCSASALSVHRNSQIGTDLLTDQGKGKTNTFENRCDKVLEYQQIKSASKVPVHVSCCVTGGLQNKVIFGNVEMHVSKGNQNKGSVTKVNHVQSNVTNSVKTPVSVLTAAPFKTPTPVQKGLSVQYANSNQVHTSSNAHTMNRFKTPSPVVNINASKGKSPSPVQHSHISNQSWSSWSDLSYTTPSPRNNSSLNHGFMNESLMKRTPPMCECGRRTTRKIVQSPGPNNGRPFYCCPLGRKGNIGKKSGCGYFKWEPSCSISPNLSNLSSKSALNNSRLSRNSISPGILSPPMLTNMCNTEPKMISPLIQPNFSTPRTCSKTSITSANNTTENVWESEMQNVNPCDFDSSF